MAERNPCRVILGGADDRLEHSTKAKTGRSRSRRPAHAAAITLAFSPINRSRSATLTALRIGRRTLRRSPRVASRHAMSRSNA